MNDKQWGVQAAMEQITQAYRRKVKAGVISNPVRNFFTEIERELRILIKTLEVEPESLIMNHPITGEKGENDV